MSARRRRGEVAQEWRVSNHAARRYRERFAPHLDHSQAVQAVRALARGAIPTRRRGEGIYEYATTAGVLCVVDTRCNSGRVVTVL